MGRSAFAMRGGFGTLAMLFALGASSCEQFDPVKSDNLCEREDGHAISMLCPQCAEPPYAWNCSECFKMLRPDPEMCEPREEPLPATNPDGGSSGAGGSSGGEAGEGGQSGGGGEGGAGGEGEPGAGSGGMSGGPMSGAGGEPMVDPTKCTSDLWCRSMDNARPACDGGNCVECLRDDHCPGDDVCNTTVKRCQNCIKDADCPVGVCNKSLEICVECQQHGDCTEDPIKNACDMETFQCVDCVGTVGCSDDDPDGIKTTCLPSAKVCVDCLEDGDCSDPAKPACNKQARECVECMLDDHCDDPVKGTCDPTTRTCVDCLNNNGCGGTATPQCDTTAKACVECTGDSHCASGHCFEQECVQCKVDADCPSATASHCDEDTHTCVACSANAHCAHLDDTPACFNGRCVECNDDSTCGDFSCIRSQHVCSDVRKGSVAVCRECQADSMCQSGMLCVPLQFDGEPYGSYCVYTRSSRGGNCANARPYSRAISNTRSVDGVTQSVCGPPASTTCPGVIDATSTLGGIDCSSASDCGVEGMADAQCAESGCTYGCTSSADCASPATCLTNLTCG